MTEATDSSVVSQLFTQGRHRNPSVLILLKNMFPKEKYHTDTSHNVRFLALFRSPNGREQIEIAGERIFDKSRIITETKKLFGYLLVNNKPDTHTALSSAEVSVFFCKFL